MLSSLESSFDNTRYSFGRELTMDGHDANLQTLRLDAEPTRASIRKWPQKLKNQRKMELHCKRMARFRNRRSVEKKSMEEEHRRLEKELEQRVAELRGNGVCLGSGSLAQVQSGIQRLVLERELLRDESVALKQQIAKHIKYQRVIHSASDKLTPSVIDYCHTDGRVQAANATVRYLNSTWQSVQEEAGWRVHFPGGDPSFVFHPFSRQEFNAVLSRHDTKSSAESASLAFAGTFLGWQIYHGTTVPGKEWLLGHVRCCKRIDRSIDAILVAMRNDDGLSKWPIMPISKDLSVAAEISIQTLQELDEDSSVIVRNYTGSVNYRYMCLVQHAKLQMIDGNRALTFYYVLGDSEANARSRDADATTVDEVCWITEEGGYSLTLLEVDEATADVVFDSVGCFRKPEQVLGHFVMFGHVVTRWEEIVLSLNLLKFD